MNFSVGMPARYFRQKSEDRTRRSAAIEKETSSDSKAACLGFNMLLGGGFKDFLCSPLFGEDEPNLTCAYFSEMG